MNKISLFLVSFCVLFSLSMNGKPKLVPKNAQDVDIVILSSYNPDVKNISDNISAFYEECKALNLNNNISIEDLHVQNLPECFQWKDRLWKIIQKYYEKGRRPVIFVLLGAEASSAYFSLDKPELKSIPIIIGMRGRDVIKLPSDESVDLRTWSPKHYDLVTDFSDYNIVGGYVYSYDFQKNLDLIKFFYPKRDSLYFVTDNTLGGLAMQAGFKEFIDKGNSKYKVGYIDGRNLNYLEVNSAMSSMGNKSVILAGTWRIDRSNKIVVRDASYTFGSVCKKVPVFSVSDIGLGHWPIGGYSPVYHVTGKELAKDVANYLKTGEKKTVTPIDNKYIFDVQRLKMMNLSLNRLNVKYEVVNKPFSVYEQYKVLVWIAALIFCIILVSFFMLIYYLRKSKLQTVRLIAYSHEMVVIKNIAEKARAESEKANKMKLKFIADMSHEIRTPLNAVVGFSQLLTNGDYAISEDEKTTYGEYILANNDILLKLIDDILCISKIDSGKISFNKNDTDIVALCNFAMLSSSVRLESKVTMLVKSSHPKLIINTDKDRVLQVLFNLINNSIKNTASGSIVIEAKLEDDGKKMIEVSVTDTGCGIPKEKAELVFHRFVKLDSYKQGTGLGLAISQSIIENLGGRIYIDTTYTNGARFVFTLPQK